MKSVKNIKLHTLFLLTLLLGFTSSSFANENPCDQDLAAAVEPVVVLDEEAIQLNQAHEKYLQTAKIPLIQSSELLPILESDLDSYKLALTDLFSHLSTLKPTAARAYLREFFTAALTKNFFSPEEIQQRLNAWFKKSDRSLYKMLGRRSLEEVKHLYIGEDLHAISKESLIGQYIANTGAKTKVIQYPIAPDSEVLGPEKLLIAVSNTSFPELNKILATPYFMSVVGHANIVYHGKLVSYGGGNFQDLRLFADNTPLPFTLLSASESERLGRYLEQTKHTRDWNTPLKQPWQLAGYCARGGFPCCTHWIGNIPIGDKLVTEYAFPPADHQAADGPQVAPLVQYAITEQSKALAKIWKVPGHEQFSGVLGQLEANTRGEFASPGWVITTLMGATTNERVPVIFWVTQDHTADIPDHYPFNFEDPR